MARSQFHQVQTGSSSKDASYLDGLTVALDTTAETANGVTLIPAESVAFAAAGNVVTFGTSNPLALGVIPGDFVRIAGSTSDDNDWLISAVTATTVTVVGSFAAADGGSATGQVITGRDLLSDLNLLRSQVRRITGEPNWYDAPTIANNPFFNTKKLLYATENKTNISVPAAGFADISTLGLTPYADSSDPTDEGVLASTTAPTAGGGYKSEGTHWVRITDASSGEPITVNGFEVYGYIIVDDFDTPTTEEVHFVYFDEVADAEVLVTNLSTQQAGSSTNFEITYVSRTSLANIPEDFGLFPTHLEMPIDVSVSLQSAYIGGNTIQLSDTEGDLIVETDDTGSVANIIFRKDGAVDNFFATDTTANQVELGAATISVQLLGNTVVTTGNTFSVINGQSTFGGNVDANSGLDVSGITNLGDGGVTNYARFTAAGDLSFVGTADSITKSDGTLALAVSGGTNDLDIDSGRNVLIDAVSAFSIDGAAASNVSVTGANLTLSTITSGNVALSAAGLLTFNDSFWAGGGGTPDPLPFADAGNTNFIADFTTDPVSLIDAINQARSAVSNHFNQADSIPGGTIANANVTIPGGFSYIDATDFVENFVFFVNGQKMRNGANAAANFDCYPGTTLTTVRFEFRIQPNDTLSVFKFTP